MGSVASKMSADPRTLDNTHSPSPGPGPSSTLSQQPPNGLPSPNDVPTFPRPQSTPPATAARGSSGGPVARDINALRAAAVKSRRLKKLREEAASSSSQSSSLLPPPLQPLEEGEVPSGREEGEIDEDEETSSPSLAPPPAAPAAPPPQASTSHAPTATEPASAPAGIVRSMVVTISPNQAAFPDASQGPSELG